MARVSSMLVVVVASFLVDAADASGGNFMLGAPYEVSEVNTPSVGDLSPSLSPNGLELYYNNLSSGTSDLWVARRESIDHLFGAGTPLTSLNTSSNEEANPDVSGDGLTLYFNVQSSGGDDIWMSTRSSLDDAWQSPIRLPSPINTDDGWEGRPSVSADGLVLAYDGHHNRDSNQVLLRLASRPSINEPFGIPVVLDDRFVSGSSPGLSADGLTLYFARWVVTPGARVPDESTIWVASRISRDAPFNDPVLLDAVINSQKNVADPDPSLDGSALYYVSSDFGSGALAQREADIYAAAFIPEPSTFLLTMFSLVGASILRPRRRLSN